MNTRKFLELAVDQAAKALESGNFPCGAVLVNKDGNIAASEYNQRHSLHDVTAHAEIQCLRQVSDEELENNEYSLFCSSEPCGGCAFFLARTNIKQIYWALNDPQKKGLRVLSKNKETKEFFNKIKIFEEFYSDLKKKSANLLRQYYLKNKNSVKANLYL